MNRSGCPKDRSLWPLYLRDSQLVLITTDSTLESVLWTRRMLPNIHSWIGGASLLCMANKQDIPSALTGERVGSILGIETILLTALDMFDSSECSRLIERIIDFLGLLRDTPHLRAV
ncbi:MAG: ADP-ribosylation factor-like protein [Promethearchaeia archaeon]